MTNYIKKITKTDLKKGILTLSHSKLELLRKYRGEEIWLEIGNDYDSKPYMLNDDNDNNLRFSGLKKWYEDRNIKIGTKIRILFDEKELYQNLHVIHLELV